MYKVNRKNLWTVFILINNFIKYFPLQNYHFITIIFSLTIFQSILRMS